MSNPHLMPTNPKLLTVADVTVELHRKRIKHVHLRILPPDGRVRVSAPYAVCEAAICELVLARREWIRTKQALVRAKAQQPQPAPLESHHREQLRLLIPPLIATWAPRLGVQVAEWGIRAMKTRWGSCNVRARRIWLNLELIRHRPECLEYVVVHELAHLLEKGHNARFYAVLDDHLPRWRELRAVLNGKPGATPREAD